MDQSALHLRPLPQFLCEPFNLPLSLGLEIILTEDTVVIAKDNTRHGLFPDMHNSCCFSPSYLALRSPVWLKPVEAGGLNQKTRIQVGSHASLIFSL